MASSGQKQRRVMLMRIRRAAHRLDLVVKMSEAMEETYMEKHPEHYEFFYQYKFKVNALRSELLKFRKERM